MADDATAQLAVVGQGDTERPPAEQRRRGRRALVVVGVVVLLLVGAAAGAVFVLSENLGNNIARVPNVFGALDESGRPTDEPGLNLLLVGTDSRSVGPTTGTDAAAGVDAGSERSDVIMLAQLAPDRRSASVVSIPRDSWVDIPGRGPGKANAAYAFGGATLLTQTVEQLTGVRVDHFAVIDFAGFQSMVDAVGGIDVQVAEATSNEGVQFAQGLNSLDGAQALAYVRQRNGLPNGDLDRARRQQNALRSLLGKAASSGTLTDPIRLISFLDATSRSVSVDDTLSNGGLRSLAFESRELRPSGVVFLSAPVAGLGREGDQSVVYLDANAGPVLWAAFRDGSAAGYVVDHPDASLSATPS